MIDTVSSVAREAPAGGRWSVPRLAAADGSSATAAVTRVLSQPELVGMAFQPIVDLGRGVVCGYEALARFPPELGPPDVWIAAARAAGVGDRLEALLVGKALDVRPSLPANCFLSLNVSLAALASSALEEVLYERQDLSAVVLEVTEQTDAPPGLFLALRSTLCVGQGPSWPWTTPVPGTGASTASSSYGRNS